MKTEFRSALNLENEAGGGGIGAILAFLGFGKSSVIDGYDYGSAAEGIHKAIAVLERNNRNGRNAKTPKLEQRIQELKLDRLKEDKLTAESNRQWGKANTIQQEYDRVAAKRYG